MTSKLTSNEAKKRALEEIDEVIVFNIGTTSRQKAASLVRSLYDYANPNAPAVTKDPKRPYIYHLHQQGSVSCPEKDPCIVITEDVNTEIFATRKCKPLLLERIMEQEIQFTYHTEPIKRGQLLSLTKK